MISMPLTRDIYQLMSTVQLPLSKTFYLQIIMNYSTQNNEVGMAKQSQKTSV